MTVFFEKKTSRSFRKHAPNTHDLQSACCTMGDIIDGIIGCLCSLLNPRKCCDAVQNCFGSVGEVYFAQGSNLPNLPPPCPELSGSISSRCGRSSSAVAAATHVALQQIAATMVLCVVVNCAIQ